MERVIPEALDWIDRLHDAPTLLFLHTYAVHEPNPEFAAMFQGSVGRGGSKPYRPSPKVQASDLAWYANLVRRADQELEPLFDKLRAASLKRAVLLVIVSDHGEAFGEHNIYGHGQGTLKQTTLHDELTHVPIIIWGPGLVPAKRALSQSMMLSDVAPSMLAAAGIRAPESMLGQSLWPLWSGDAAAANDSLGGVSHTERAWTYRDASTRLIAPQSIGSLHRLKGGPHVDHKHKRGQ